MCVDAFVGWCEVVIGRCGNTYGHSDMSLRSTELECDIILRIIGIVRFLLNITRVAFKEDEEL